MSGKSLVEGLAQMCIPDCPFMGDSIKVIRYRKVVNFQIFYLPFSLFFLAAYVHRDPYSPVLYSDELWWTLSIDQSINQSIHRDPSQKSLNFTVIDDCLGDLCISKSSLDHQIFTADYLDQLCKGSSKQWAPFQILEGLFFMKDQYQLL